LTKARVVQGIKPVVRKNLTDVTVSQSNVVSDGECIGPYKITSNLGTTGNGELFEGFDPVLMRNIWIQKLSQNESAKPLSECDYKNSAGRLHWIGGRRTDNESWDAYEAPGGQSFVTIADSGCSWENLRLWIADIAQEIKLSERLGTQPKVLNLDRIWITQTNHAKIIDFPLPGQENSENISVQKLFQEMLNYVKERTVKQKVCPYPLYVLEEIDSIILEKETDTIHQRLVALQQRPFTVSKRKHILHMAILSAPALIFVTMALLAYQVVALRSAETPMNRLAAYLLVYSDHTPVSIEKHISHDSHEGKTTSRVSETTITKFELKLGREDKAPAGKNKEEYETLKKALEIVLAHDYMDILEKRNVKLLTFPFKHPDVYYSQDLLKELSEKYMNISPDEEQKARSLIRSHYGDRPMNIVLGKEPPHSFEFIILFVSTFITLFFVAFPALLAALCVRRGLSLRVLGIQFVNNQGTKAGRMRMLARAVITFTPLVVILFMVPAQLTLLASVTMLAYIAAGLLPAVYSKRSLQDRIVRTWAVPE